MSIKEIIAKMTLEEKASLCSGQDFWTLKGIERLGLGSIMVTDGPHGVRKQAGDSDHLGLNVSVPSTCFPTACTTSSSFDRSLMHDIGVALGEECLQENVSVLLGPGANIKRSPLCGRNFEYMSEDPYVTGEIASSVIAGIQSKGIGTSLKHYAMNNQEKNRMTSNSVVDERAMREIYLTGFEQAVKKSQPYTVMCSYNLVNGTYVNEDKKLLTDILRDEWGYEGLVVSDWGATSDRVKGISAGMDLEMPSSNGYNDAKIVEAVKNGTLLESELDVVVTRIVDLILKAQENRNLGFKYDVDAHSALARRAAEESSVLLKNENSILPINKEQSIAVIGEFAKQPRYQGAGSSRINPIYLDSVIDSLVKDGIAFDYASGYSLAKNSKVNEDLIEEACNVAKDKDIVLIFAGLPDEYESEGYDRTTMSMPESHNELIKRVSEINPNVVVVLQLGSPVTMPWAHKVKGILLTYLGGGAGGSACVNLLYGDVCPSGKLAETFPLRLEDNPSFLHFSGEGITEEYRESIFVGYRYYDSAKKEVQYPFGYGLSYTSFDYSNLKITKVDEKVKVAVTVTNTGACKGAEIVQLYIGLSGSKIYRATKELKGFEKILLTPGESKEVEFILDERSFAYYNIVENDWAIEGGDYSIMIGASSRDIRLQDTVLIVGDGKEKLLLGQREKAPIYFNLSDGILDVPAEQFEVIYGRELPSSHRMAGEPFTINSTLNDIKDTPAGKQLIETINTMIGQMLGDDVSEDMLPMFEAMLPEMPLRSLVMMGGGQFTREQLDGLLVMLNSNIA